MSASAQAAQHGAPAPLVVRVRISIDLVGIRAGFARERPPVVDGDWDARAYFDERVSAYRDALCSPAIAAAGVRLELGFDDETSACDRVALAADPPAGGGCPAAVEQLIRDAARAVSAQTGAWRRHLGAGYFERHRAWRREAGSPIAH